MESKSYYKFYNDWVLDNVEVSNHLSLFKQQLPHWISKCQPVFDLDWPFRSGFEIGFKPLQKM